MSAISAFCLVALLEIARGPIEFEALGFKFKGASGPAILWVFCFLAMIFGVWLLWDKSGSIELASGPRYGVYVDVAYTAPAAILLAVRSELKSDDVTRVTRVSAQAAR